MQPIQGFESVQAVHGRSSTRLPGGAYVMRIVRCTEDLTGYGNMCLKLVYDVAEGKYAGLYAGIENDKDNDWRHMVEIDTQEAQGGRLRALVDALQASNPGYVWDWNEAALANKVVGIVLQERKVTLTRGQNKGKDRTYLDFWDAVPVDAVRAGQVEMPPVNDQREQKQQPQAVTPPPAVAPVSGQQLMQQVAQAQYQQPQVVTGQQLMQQVAQQPMAAPQQQLMQGQQVMPQPTGQAQQPQASVYDSEIPF